MREFGSPLLLLFFLDEAICDWPARW